MLKLKRTAANNNMKTLGFQIFAILLVAEVFAGSNDDSSQFQVAEANQKFAANFYKTLSDKQPAGDIFFSPLGIHTILSMIYPGSEQETRTALTNTLQVTDPAQAADGYQKILQNLNDVRNATLHIANKVYLADRYNFQEEYGSIIKDKFNSEVEKLDFGADIEAAANKVNGWVSNHTNGKIPKLFETSDFSDDTASVLLNAVYFKGTWNRKFERGDTRTEPFYVNGKDEKIDVQMMHRKGVYNYKTDADLEAQVLELPFSGDGISAVIVLPLDIDGIKKVEEKIQQNGIQKITSDLQSSHIKVALPKFKLQTKMDLKVPLTDMGLGILFDEKSCNLSKMIDKDEQLYVSKAIQKAFIEVNEEGAEATAATGAVISNVTLSVSLIHYHIFYVDHPFLILVRKHHHLLFYGRIVKPVSADDDEASSFEPDGSKIPNTESMIE